jgi:hypothetical protein
MKAVIHPRVVMFLLLHACSCTAEDTAVGAAGRFMTLIAPVERIVWLKKQSSFGS